MKKRVAFVVWFLLLTALLVVGALYFINADIAVLNPKGMIAEKQRTLLVNATLLMLIVIIPVYIMTFVFMWRYREKNKKATYAPDWDFNLLAETIWWSVPCAIVVVLSIMTWQSSYELDPYKPLASDSGKKPLTIQVVALQWKWLFIYPEEGIATIGFIQIPEQTPILFEITADAPMNSFWIPQLGGQIYAMPGMKTQLNLIANKQGSFRGLSANLSGKGFAGMTFVTKASSEESFKEWVETTKHSSKPLNMKEYNRLIEPTEHHPVTYYVLEEKGLLDKILMKYMQPMQKVK